MAQLFQWLLRKAIHYKAMKLLKFLVIAIRISLEERNQLGMTPLYQAMYNSWPEGALLLLEHGADVQNADVAPKHLCHSQPTLIELALQMQNGKLFNELIKRGYNFRSKEDLFTCTFTTAGLPQWLLRKAIHCKAMKSLKFLVIAFRISLEERNQFGMTPLYQAVYNSWLEGALLLLEHGADVQNAELGPKDLCTVQPPLIHLAVKTQNEKLLTELIKRGVNIRARDVYGNDCMDSVPISSRSFVIDCMVNAVTAQDSRRSNQDEDVVFIVHLTYLCTVHYTIQDLICMQQSCLQTKLLQLYLVCLLIKGERTLDWRPSTECKPCQHHDHMQDEETGPRSVFADIFTRRERSLLDSNTVPESQLTSYIEALLVVEKYIPSDQLLTEASLKVISLLLEEDNIVTAIGVMQCLTTVRELYVREKDAIMEQLHAAVLKMKEKDEVSSDALIDSMKVIQKCLPSKVGGITFMVYPASFSTGGDFRELLAHLVSTFLDIVHVAFSQQDVSATPEQLQAFHSLIKDFVRNFPWICGDFFHVIVADPDAPIHPSLIKMLVTYSAEVHGTVRQKKLAPHLWTDRYGNTPLHALAVLESRKILLEEGVLQCFLDHGADLCTRNKYGESVRDILLWRRIFGEGELLPSLQCLAATAFMKDQRLRQNVQNCRPTAVKNFLLDH